MARSKNLRKRPETSAFSPRDHAIAADLAEGLRQIDVAKKHGISDRAIRSKLADPAFQDLVSRLQADIFKSAVRMLGAGAREASLALRRLLRSPNESTVQKAAASLLANVVDITNLDEIRERLDALEDRVPSDRKGGVI